MKKDGGGKTGGNAASRGGAAGVRGGTAVARGRGGQATPARGGQSVILVLINIYTILLPLKIYFLEHNTTIE